MLVNSANEAWFGSALLGTFVGIGVGVLLFIVTSLRARSKQTVPQHTFGRFAVLVIIALLLEILLIFGIAHFNPLLVFILVYPLSFVQGILIVYAVLELYLALADNGVYLPHQMRGILCIAGASLALITFYHLPIFVNTYSPPAHFPTVINGVQVSAFSSPEYFDKLVDAPIDFALIGVKLPYHTLFGLLCLLIFGIISLFWDAFALLVATQFLFVVELLLFWVALIIYIAAGFSNYSAQQDFISALGGTGQALQAGQYYTQTPAIGFYLLCLSFLLMAIAMFVPAEISDSAQTIQRSLLISIGTFALFLILTHVTSVNQLAISWQQGSGITQFIGAQIENIATAGFWPLIGGIVGSVLMLTRQRG